MPSPKDGKLLYHLTHIDNIESILESGLMSRNQLNDLFVDTADQNIIANRHEYTVDLSNYVPFHFFVKNPYDGAVCKKHGSENMAIIAIWRPTVNFEGYYIIPTHPLSGSPEFLPYCKGFEKVPWHLMDNSNDRSYSNQVIKNACMAECDVDHTISVADFAFVYVKTEHAKNRILQMPNAWKIRHKLQVKPNMFP